MKRAISLLVIPVTVAVFADDVSKGFLTMIDMRDIALAWEAFATDHNSYLRAEDAKLLPVTPKEEPRKWTDLTLVPRETLQTMLAPTYIRSVPTVDAWGAPFEFGVVNTGAFAQQYFIRSLGADKRDDRATLDAVGDSANADIVFSNGKFHAYSREANRRFESGVRLSSMHGPERVPMVLDLAGISYTADGQNAWTVAVGNRKLSIRSGAKDVLITALVAVPNPPLNAMQLQMLIGLQSGMDWDDNGMKVFLPGQGVAVRARAPIDFLYPEPFKKLLQAISAGADEMAKIISR